MDTPAAALYDDIARIDEALEPFAGPEVEERSGLRWMQRTLVQRRAHIMTKITEIERSTLTLRVRDTVGTSAVPVTTIASLLGAVQDALHAATSAVAWPDALDDQRRRDALTLQVGDATTSDERWVIHLHRPAGPLSAQPVTSDGERLAVDIALAAMLEALGADAGDIGQTVVAHGLTVELSTSPTTGEGGSVVIDRHTAIGGRRS